MQKGSVLNSNNFTKKKAGEMVFNSQFVFFYKLYKNTS